MKKILLLILVVAVLCFAMCACGEKKEPEANNGEQEVATNVPEVENGTEESEENEEEYEIPFADETVYQKFRIKYNGIEFGVKDKFDDVKDGLGAESRPPQTYTPCAASVEGEVTTHYYEGLTLETNNQGIIYTIKFSSFDNPGSTAELVTGIKLGSTHDALIEAYGATDSDDEYNTTYSYENLYVGFSYDVDGSGDVNYFSIETML